MNYILTLFTRTQKYIFTCKTNVSYLSLQILTSHNTHTTFHVRQTQNAQKKKKKITTVK